MSEITIMNMDCTPEDGVCNCDISDLHMSCYRNRTEVYAALPESGREGTTYYIGTNAGGYTEYVWNGTAFVELGTASGSFYNRATVDALGLVKLSTASVVSGGSVIGMNSDGQLRVPVATLTAYGSVKLGSRYHPTNEIPYVVGIGCSASETTYGQLCFNLSPTQSDGSPGCLVYEQISDSPIEYTMKVKEGSASQMGIVKLLSSLTGYTDEEITAMRDTHAASVGLVVDGLDTFCEGFFTEYRMQGYFDEWANGKSLSQEIWDDEAKRGVLVDGVSELVAASDRFSAIVDAKTVEWLTAKATDEYFEELFGERIDALAKQYWTGDLISLVESVSADAIEENFQDELKICLSVPENVSSVAAVVAEESKSILAEGKDEIIISHVEDIVDGVVPVEIGGEETTFPEYIHARIDSFIQEALSSVNERISDVGSKVAQLRAGAGLATAIGVATEGVSLPGCADYDFIELRTNKGSCFCIPVWTIKRAFACGKAYSFVDVWGWHDDDVEYDGGQVRITDGWKFSALSNRTNVFPMQVYGLKYAF